MKPQIVVIVGLFLILFLGCLDFRSDDEKAMEAVEKQDSELCNSIGNHDKKYACKGWIEKDSGMCEKINEKTIIDDTPLRDQCFRRVAWAIKDPDLCEKVIDVEWRDVCYNELAFDRRDSKLCGKMSDQTLDLNELIIDSERVQVILRDGCYMDTILFEPDEGVCNNIENSKLRNSCYTIVANGTEKS